MATDYSEILMQSMDILVAKRLSELQFDKTINCQITDTSAADKGEYEVTDGATTFTAYSRDVTYKVGDSVYVTIPNGNFDNQKQIVGKYVSPGESLNHLSPLDSYVDITGDLCNFTEEASLLANREDVLVLDKKNNIQTCETYSKQVIWKAKIQNGKGFERLGIQADFKTKLKSLKTNNGNFGLCLYVTYIDKSNVNSEDSVKTASFILDSDDMYGNPYNFNSYFTQEKVFDISSITGQITDMALVFYQDFNFTDVSGMSIPHYEIKIDPKTEEEVKEYFMPNISVNNIHISMGYDISKFNEDTVLVYCLNEPTYNYNNLTQENRKTLQVRWVRVTNEGIYSIDSEKEIPENAAIHWYKYQIKIQDEVDELAGPMWFEIEEGLNKLQLDVDPDTKELTQLYKVIVEIPSRQWIEAKLDARLNDDYANLKYLAEEGADEETKQSAQMTLESYESEIKGQRKIYSSEVIEFKSEVPVVDKMTADLINGLRIEIDEKGYKGNFLLYNPSNRISNINEATKMRVMRATYKSLVTGEQTLDGAESIIWKIPLTSTMIYPPEAGKEYESDSSTSYWVENGYAYIKRMSGNSNAGSMGTVNDWSCEQKFRIKDYYQENATNNIVYCYVVKNNTAYEASAEMFFGPKGSNGTDFTFKMFFDQSTVGVTAHTEETKDYDQIIKINLAMYDFFNEKVPNFWNNGVDITWYQKDLNNVLSFCDAAGKTIDKPVIDSNKCFYIKYPKLETKIPHAAILQAEVTTDPTVKGGEGTLENVKITAYLPIPYRSRDTLSGMTGATKIVYDSLGTNPEYDKIAYSLIENEQPIEGLTWTIFSPEYNANQNGVVSVTQTYYNGDSENATEQERTVAKNVQPMYFPMINNETEIVVPSMYTELNGDKDRQIYITAKLGQETLWSQPIMMFRDAFSSPMLNAWDGGLTINENSGTILSTMIGAGKKDEKNRFNGVLMGDVKDAISNLITLGLYGFNEGVQSFGWKVDGTGFIGKSGQGQILFDGNRGTISSGIWRNSNHKIGMEIDLDGPTEGRDNWDSTGSTFKMYGAAGKIDIDTSKSSTKLFNIQGRINPRRVDGSLITNPNSFKYQDLIKISIDVDKAYAGDTDEVSADTSFFIQSLGYKQSNGSDAIGTRLDLQNGYFYSFGKYGRVQFATSNTTFFRLADAENKVLFIIKGGKKADNSENSDTDGAKGTDAVAQVSQYYLQSSNFSATEYTGTRLDLHKGKYTSYGKFGRIEMAPDTNTFFRLADANNKVLFVIKGTTSEDGDGNEYNHTSKYYIQSSFFNSEAKTGTRLDLQNGKYVSYGNSGYVIIDSSSKALFRIYAKSSSNYYGLMYVGNDSKYYIQNLNWATSNGAKGSKWDLNDGSFKAFGDGGKISIQPNNKEHLFQVQDSAGTTLINIGNGTHGTDNSYYYLQSSGYQLSTKDTKGKGFRIDIGNGTISASDFNLFAKGDSGYIQIGTNGVYAIDVNNKFQVAWDGDTHLRGGAALYVENGTIYSGKKGGTNNLTAGKYYEFSPSGGRIGPWHIDEKAIWTGSDISSPDSKLGSDGTILLSADSMKLSMTDTEFSVNSEDINLILNADKFKIGIDTFRYIELIRGEYGADEFTISGNQSGFSISGSECTMSTNNASFNANSGFTFNYSLGEYNQSTFTLSPIDGITYSAVGAGTIFSVSNTGMITCSGIVGGFDDTVSFTYDPGPGFDVLTFSITVSNGIVTNVSAG